MTSLLPWLSGFLLVLCRTSGLILVAPIFGTQTIPMRLRAAVALGIAFAAFSGAGFPAFSTHDRIDALALAVLGETAIGLTAGLATRLALEAARAAGHLAGLAMGLGFGSMVDPIAGAESTATAELLGVLAVGALVIAGGHREAIVWLSRSLVVQPVGGTVAYAALAMNVVDASLSGIALAVRLAFPVLSAVLVGQILLGVLSRTAPQLNLGSIGFSVTILTGGAVLYLCVPVVAEIASRQAMAALTRAR